MTHTTFVAFSSADQFVSNAIGAACEAASSPEASFIPWNRHDTSGQPIDRSVYSWVETADALVADISERDTAYWPKPVHRVADRQESI